MNEKISISDTTLRDGAQAPHHSEIRQHVTLRRRKTSKIMEPAWNGANGSSIFMSKSSDRADLKRALNGLKIDLSPNVFEETFARMKRVANQTGDVSDTQLQAIVDEVISGSEILQGVVESFR